LCTFYWQLVTGAHLQVWGLKQQPILQLIWVPFVSRLHSFLIMNRGLGSFIFAGCAIAFIVLLHFLLRRESQGRYKRLKMLPGVLLAVLLVYSLIGTHLQWRRMLDHASWGLVYIQPHFVVALFTGFGLFLYTQIMQKRSMLSWTLLLLLIT